MILYSLTSSLHTECAEDVLAEPFIVGLQKALGLTFTCRTDDYSQYGTSDETELIYVRTGGTEGIFKKIFCGSGKPVIPGGRKVRLLTSGLSNSLAASMEILSFLRQNDIDGEILHGSAEQIASRLKGEAAPATSGKCGWSIRKAGRSRILEGMRLGVIGHPSDWLISSDVDYAAARERLGVELIDIPMKELTDAIAAGNCAIPSSLKPLNVPKYGKPITDADMQKSADVYGAVKTLIGRYELDGITLRCFDLLTSVGSTGCMALALLNSEGFVATCEGDIPAMLSMAIARKVAGESGFQVNLSRISGDSLLFAHCTVPLDMVRDYVYDTHFESGIGVAVHGEFTPGEFTVFKMGSSLDEFIAEDVTLEYNCYADSLCRTQVLVKAPGLGSYFLTSPLGNHHILLRGHLAGKLEEKLG